MTPVFDFQGAALVIYHSRAVIWAYLFKFCFITAYLICRVREVKEYLYVYISALVVL